MNDQNSSEEIAQATQIIAQTPATLPLKRSTPVFAEATLQDQPQENATPAPEPATAISSTEPTVDPVVNSVAEAPVAEATVAEAPVAPPISGLPSIEFSPPPGAPFQASLTLELRSSAPDAEIRYALNADDVGADGALYNPAEKIFLPQSASIAARVFVNNQPGPLTTARFEIQQPAWQSIELLDQSDPTPHEIGEQSALEGPWKLAAASVRGKLHAHRGFWREDSLSYGLANASDGTYAITIVSDGAGSANLSRVGSKLLCAVALEHLTQGLTAFAPLASDDKTLISRDLPLLRALLVEAASLALQKLREEAARREKALGDFSSTLLILVRREWNGAQLCAALQSGDGAIALWDEDEDLTILGTADHGEHSSETKFLTTGGMEAELPSRVKFSIRPNLRAAMVMSDGVADDFFPETVRFPELFGQVLPRVEADFAVSGAALLDWIKYEKKGSSDDRALVVSWRDSGQNPAPNGKSAPVEAVAASEEPSHGEQ